MKKSIILSTIFIVIGASTLPAIVSADQINEQTQIYNRNVKKSVIEKEKQNAIQKFTEMQNKITDSMYVENGRYIYDETTIKNIINSFDFVFLKEKTGIEYTNISFFNVAITNIKQTRVIDLADRGGNKYNENKVQEGWNYGRFWWDETNTTKKIDQLEDVADKITFGTITGGGILELIITYFGGAFGAVFSMLVSMGIGIEAWLLNNIATNLERVQNGTGTVLEINKFTAVYDCWSQDKYPG